MEYSVEDLKKLALEEGFTNAGQLNLKALVFMPEVRQMCSADKCHAYGRNWRCPPACGSLEESAALAAQYSFGMIVQTVGHMEDEYDYETIERAGKEHADCFINYSSMEAYGLWVSKVCELSGIPYNYGPNTIAYTSCFLLK